MIGLSRSSQPSKLAVFWRETLGVLPWKVITEGDDILLLNVRATAFGLGDNEDDGRTASGVDLRLHPYLKGVALPMRTPRVRSLMSSPIPMMPFGVNFWGKDRPDGAHVILEDVITGKASPIVPVIDLGPSLWTGNAVDLTVNLAQVFVSSATANNFARKLNVRIYKGATYL